MRTFTILSALLLAVALAAPAPAVGQSAGDEQYTDPFQEEAGGGGGGQQGGGQPQGDVPQAPVPTPAPAPAPAPAPETGVTDPTVGSALSVQPSSAAPTATNILPVTGVPAALAAAVGAALVLGGAALRRIAR